MGEIKTKWVELDDSHFLMAHVLRTGWQRAEWLTVGEVQLRQISAASEPKYFAIVNDQRVSGKNVLERFASVVDAKASVETYVATVLKDDLR